MNPAKSSLRELAQPGALELHTPAPTTGSEAPTLQVHFEDAEYSSPAASPPMAQDLVRFNVPASLLNRKLFGSIWTSASAPNENWIKAQINFFLNGSPVGWLPWGTGNSVATLQRSIPSALNSSANLALADTVQLFSFAPGALVTSPAALQAFYFRGKFDRISVSLMEVVGISAVRIYLGCISYAS